MTTSARQLVNTDRALGVIMGGGEGRRLFPLTKERAKPAVPIAGKYRLVDIPISNCINSNIRRMYILTQFNSASLHRHLHDSYQFDRFSRGFVEVLAAQQTFGGSSWYQGTADAVRQNMRFLMQDQYEHIIILSGDQLYRMDFRQVLQQHLDTEADITIATIPVRRPEAKSLGIMAIDEQKRIVRFVEKPKEEAVLDSLCIQEPLRSKLAIPGTGDHLLASMGIYIFNREVLRQSLDNTMTDFGKHIIPESIANRRVFAYVFQGYWEDVGTIRSFFDANLAMCSDKPSFDLFERTPVYTHARFLPPARLVNSHVNQSLLADGSIILNSRLDHCIVGVRTFVEGDCELRDTIVMGCDFLGARPANESSDAPMGIPHMRIGRGCRINRAIIDKNVRIGDGVVITDKSGQPDVDAPTHYVRDGIVIIPKNADLPAGLRI